MSVTRSPRAPSLTLPKALDKALAAYAQVGCQAAPTETMAQHLGYASLNSGRALATLASLRYFGLLESVADGMLAVSATVEQYRNLPEGPERQALRLGWLRKPAVFASLLERFPQGLPSDAMLHQELIQRGFQPSAAQSCAAVLRESVAFVWPDAVPPSLAEPEQPAPAPVAAPAFALTVPLPTPDWSQSDCIPVRLSGGRRAWLVVPATFYEVDKARLKAQIDLLLTEDQNG